MATTTGTVLVTGANLTLDSNARNERRLYNAEANQTIVELVPAMTPFLTMMSKLGKQPTTDVEFKWQESYQSYVTQQEFFFRAITDATGWTDAGGRVAIMTFATTSGGAAALIPYLKVGSLIRLFDANASTADSVWLVQAVPASASTGYTCYCVTTTTDAGSNGGDYLTNIVPAQNDKCYIIGSAFSEYSNVPTTTNEYPEVRWGSCQIFKTTVTISRRAKKIKAWSDVSEWVRVKKQGLEEHKISIEKDLMFGHRSGGSDGLDPFGSPLATVNPLDVGLNRLNTTAGLLQTISYSSSTSLGGQTTFTITPDTYNYGDFISNMRTMFRYSTTQEKWCIAGGDVIEFLQGMVFDQPKIGTNEETISGSPITISSSYTSYGIKVNSFTSIFGTINFIYHPLLEGELAKYGFILDLDNVKIMTFDDTMWVDDAIKDGVDGETGYYLTDCGLCLKQPRTHGLFVYAG